VQFTLYAFFILWCFQVFLTAQRS